MSDLLKRIADYFANDYQGDDKTAPTMEITVNDLRYIANMNVDRCRAESELRNIKYNKCKDCDGCVQCKVDEAIAIQEYIDKVVEELKEKENEAVLKAPNTSDITNPEYQKWMMKSYGFKESIEIVKQGGVCSNCIEAGNCDVRADCPNMPSNDVCEWRIVDRPNNFPIYNTSCGKIRLQYSTGIDVYCNGCGKKIKVVGD